MLFLMDENFCFLCFCTEKYEKCVRPDKNLSIKAAPQGREYKKNGLLCRNRISACHHTHMACLFFRLRHSDVRLIQLLQ